jgi:hypothetical protein
LTDYIFSVNLAIMSFEFSKSPINRKITAATAAFLLLAGCSKDSKPDYTAQPRSKGVYTFILGCDGKTELSGVTIPESKVGATALFGCTEPEGFKWVAFVGVPDSFAGSPVVDPEIVKQGAEVSVHVIGTGQSELPEVVSEGQDLSVRFNETIERVYIDSVD